MFIIRVYGTAPATVTIPVSRERTRLSAGMEAGGSAAREKTCCEKAGAVSGVTAPNSSPPCPAERGIYTTTSECTRLFSFKTVMKSLFTTHEFVNGFQMDILS